MKLQYKKASQLTVLLLVLGFLINFSLKPYINLSTNVSPLTNLSLANSLPNISLPNLAGETKSLSDWNGNNIILNFWATWCAPCLREIPMLNQLQESKADSLQVIGIAVDREEPVQKFSSEFEINYPILIGQIQSMEAAQAFGVNVFALPFTVFILASNETLGVYTGELHQEQIDNALSIMETVNSGTKTLDEGRILFLEI